MQVPVPSASVIVMLLPQFPSSLSFCCRRTLYMVHSGEAYLASGIKVPLLWSWGLLAFFARNTTRCHASRPLHSRDQFCSASCCLLTVSLSFGPFGFCGDFQIPCLVLCFFCTSVQCSIWELVFSWPCKKWSFSSPFSSSLSFLIHLGGGFLWPCRKCSSRACSPCVLFFVSFRSRFLLALQEVASLRFCPPTLIACIFLL